MKNTAITRLFQFLEDHIDLILVLFFPAWFGILFALGGILKLLPDEIEEKVGPQWISLDFFIERCYIIRKMAERNTWRFRSFSNPSSFGLFVTVNSVLILYSQIVWSYSLSFETLSGKYNKTKASLQCKRFPLREEQILIRGRQIVLL